MTDLFPPTPDDMIAELERELAQRQRVYPRLIGAGRLDNARAVRQVARLAAAIEFIRHAAPIMQPQPRGERHTEGAKHDG